MKNIYLSKFFSIHIGVISYKLDDGNVLFIFA